MTRLFWVCGFGLLVGLAGCSQPAPDEASAAGAAIWNERDYLSEILGSGVLETGALVGALGSQRLPDVLHRYLDEVAADPGLLLERIRLLGAAARGSVEDGGLPMEVVAAVRAAAPSTTAATFVRGLTEPSASLLDELLTELYWDHFLAGDLDLPSLRRRVAGLSLAEPADAKVAFSRMAFADNIVPRLAELPWAEVRERLRWLVAPLDLTITKAERADGRGGGHAVRYLVRLVRRFYLPTAEELRSGVLAELRTAARSGVLDRARLAELLKSEPGDGYATRVRAGAHDLVGERLWQVVLSEGDSTFGAVLRWFNDPASLRLLERK